MKDADTTMTNITENITVTNPQNFSLPMGREKNTMKYCFKVSNFFSKLMEKKKEMQNRAFFE